MPHGGFGNLIALPLQGKPRKSGNSVFVDTDLNPFADQWAYLSQLGRVPASRAESLVREAEKKGRVLGVKAVEKDELLASAPWKAPPSRRPRDPPVTGPPSRSGRACARRRHSTSRSRTSLPASSPG